MRRWLVRGVFLAAVLALPLQVAVREVRPEPYPGLYQPSFGGPVVTGSTYETLDPRVTVTEADGSSRVVDYRDVLAPTPVLPSAVFNSAFRDDARARDPRTVAWLRQRLVEVDPGTDPRAVTIEWARVEHRVDSDRSRERGIERTLVLDLAGTS